MILASNNAHKLEEFRAIFADMGIEIIPQSAAGCHFEVDETGETFEENAYLKAIAVTRATGQPAVADDSGLMVDALGGAPGVRSARFAGPEADDAANRRLLLERLADVPAGARRARVRCVLVYLRHADDPWPQIFTGTWEGEIALEEAGSHGFGYDPLFWVPARGCTAAQLAPADKALLSHRAQATAALRAFLQDRLAPSHD